MAIKSGEIEGLDKLIEDLLKFGDKAMPYLKAAAEEADQVVYNRVKANVKKFKNPTGQIEKSIKIRKAKISKKNPYLVTGDVHIDKGATTPEGAWYASQVELGHNLKRNGNWVGAVKERPFLRPAADASKEQVGDILVNAMNKAFEELSE
jgi:HK97 gp10 family phage protein